MKPQMDDLTKYKKLNSYLTVKTIRKKALPIPVQTILKGLEQGKSQSMLARELGRTRSAVSQRVASMRKKGLLSPQISKQNGAHDFSKDYDKRNHSVKWELASEVKLPLDDINKIKGLDRGYRKLRGGDFNKDACYFINEGAKGKRSIEIFGGEVSGSSPQEVNLWLFYEALNIYKWLCRTYPNSNLEKASGGIRNYKINREGELNDLKGAELARLALEQTGSSVVYFGNPPRFKADRSTGYPELQELPDTALGKRLDGIENVLNRLVEKQTAQQGILERLTTSLEKLTGLLTPKEPPKEPAPPELSKDERMFG